MVIKHTGPKEPILKFFTGFLSDFASASTLALRLCVKVLVSFGQGLRS
jgi:hypothetical protein